MYKIIEKKSGLARYHYISTNGEINYFVGGYTRRGARKRLEKRFPWLYYMDVRFQEVRQ